MRIYNKKGGIRAEFQNLVYDAVKANGGKVVEYIDYGYPCSYVIAHVQVFHRDVYVFATNRGKPHMAFTYQSPDVNSLDTYKWADIPELAKHFRSHFKILPAKKLSEKTRIKGEYADGTTCRLKYASEYADDPRRESLDWDFLDDFDFNAGDKKVYLANDFDYENQDDGYYLWLYRPETIGEILFNWWD